jgi:hypothetical protein
MEVFVWIAVGNSVAKNSQLIASNKLGFSLAAFQKPQIVIN